MPENNQKKIRVLIVDDHSIVRQGLRTYLELYEEFEVIGEAENGARGVEMAAALHPDVVLMDLVMPELDGIAATQKICALGAGIKVLALTSFAEEDKVIPAIQAGASGYLLKDVSPADLVEAIQAVARGEVRLNPHAAQRLMQQVTRPAIEPAIAELTERESEVLRQVAKGLSNREIAERLVISEKTVKTHVSNILSKLNLGDRTQLAIYALKKGLASDN
jgi:NarL family two-component system response regulator LiaR